MKNIYNADITKSFSIRTDKERINAFQNACENLPINLNSRKIIESYMDYIISLSDDYRKGKSITMGFLKKDSAIVFFDTQGIQTTINFDEMEIIKNDNEGKFKML